MDLTTILGVLEPNFTRTIIQATDYPTAISYLNANGLDLTVNTDTYTNPQQICLVGKSDGVALYVNTLKGKYHKTSIANIETLTTGE